MILIKNKIRETNGATQIINSFLNSMISVNHEKGEEFLPVVKSFSPYCLFNVEYLIGCLTLSWQGRGGEGGHIYPPTSFFLRSF